MIVPVAGGKFAKVHSPPTKTGTLFECRVPVFVINLPLNWYFN